MVIDEVGKMELFSRKFVQSVRALFEDVNPVSSHSDPTHMGVVILATIPIARSGQRSHELLEMLRNRRDCLLYEVCTMVTVSVAT